MNNKKQESQGFTLLEMVVVLAVIAILAAILTPIITSYVERARLNAARNDLKNIAASVVQYNTDTKVWPIYTTTAFSTTPDLNGAVYDVVYTSGNNAIVGGGYTGTSTNGDLDSILNGNTMNVTTSGPRAWKGAYLELGADPWGTRYYLTAKSLKPTSTNAAFILSPGPNQTIDTTMVQSQSGAVTTGGDDLLVRIK
jgi:prepilin-type N-terminal cleavage/methylation domain-containing protein